MLTCKHCSTPNSLDSTFCKKCGTAVPADQKREATLQLDKLVEEGLAALNAGRPAEALAIADSAIATDPTHLGALHLKAAVHERRGEIADALESAERIVELNPDSELDRIKRNGLRSTLLSASAPVQPDRRVAFAAAAAAMVLVACAGIIVARARPTAPAPLASNAPAAGTLVETPVASTDQQAASAPTTPVTNATSQETVPPVGTPTDANAATGTTERAPVSTPSTGLSALPGPQGGIGNDGGGNLQVEPLDPGKEFPRRPKSRTPIPGVQAATGRSWGNPNPTTQDDPGQIDLQVTRGPKKAGGSTLVPETRTNGAPAYARIGTERLELGDYAGAATNLEKAVAGGGDAVELNRRLAQAYTRLGRNADAASAYERSKAAADAALASGKGDKERLQAARDAADAGLKAVKGG